MNPQLEGAVRSFIIALGSVVASAGYLKGFDWVATASVAVSLGGLAWSLWSNRPKGLIEQVAASDDVSAVITTKEMADSIPNEKVIN